MIEGTELRIGNKFHGIAGTQTVSQIMDNSRFPDGREVEYFSEYQRKAYCFLILCKENRNQYKPVEINGIPVTIKILEDSGFTKLDVTQFGCDVWEKGKWRIGKSFIRRRSEGLHFWHETSCPKESRGFYLMKIQHVHELQNIWFFLNKEELTIKID